MRAFDYQKQAIRRSRNEPLMALFMEQGTGKTFTAIKIMEHAFNRGEISRLIVFCPNTLTYNWQLELKNVLNCEYKILRYDNKTNVKDARDEVFEDFLDDDLVSKTIYQLHELGYTGTKREIINSQKKVLRILVFNYEKAVYMKQHIKRFKPDSFILDEVHKLRNHKAQRTSHVYALTRGTSRRLVLTGTPVVKGKWDLYQYIRFLDHNVFGRYTEFRQNFVRMGGFMNKEQIGMKNEKRFNDIISQYAFTKTLDMPLPDEFTISCKLPAKVVNIYKKLEEDMMVELDKLEQRLTIDQLKELLIKNVVKFKKSESYYKLFMLAEPYLNRATTEIVITKNMRLMQITGGFLKLDSGANEHLHSEKVKSLMEWIKEEKTDKPIVIGCAYIAEIELLEAELTKKNYRVANFRNVNKRDQIYKDFQEGKYDILLMQFSSGALGLNLQNADTVVFYSYTYGGDDYSQFIARIRRHGQKSRMRLVYIVAEDTKDQDILDILKSRKLENDNFIKSIDTINKK